MIIKIDGKELNIKFGYKPTLKERIISRVLKMENIADEDGVVLAGIVACWIASKPQGIQI